MKKAFSLLLVLIVLIFPVICCADGLITFQKLEIGTAETWAVYSAPGTSSWRGANGKACLSTGDSIWYAGWDGDWLLVAYPVSGGGWRTGYVSAGDVAGRVSAGNLNALFSRHSVTIPAGTSVSDDATFTRSQAVIGSPMTVTQIATVSINGLLLPYIETTLDGCLYRGYASAVQ